MKKVLVTGATGFIGNYVVRHLLNRGHHVIATSSSEQKAKIFDWYSKVQYVELDIKALDDNIDYYKYFHQPDLMMHLAWEGLPNYKASFHLEENLPRHKQLLYNLVRNGLKDLTITGTCFEYGKIEGRLSEEMECFPDNPYAIAKNELRKQLEIWQMGFPFQLKWVRLFYMYGEGQAPNSLFSQLNKALEAGLIEFNMSGGEQERDFLPVNRVVEYLVSIANQQKVTGIINCCSGKPVKVKDFIQDYLNSIGKSIKLNLGFYPYTDYEAMSFWGNNSKLKNI